MSRSGLGASAAVIVAIVLLVAGVSKLARPSLWRTQSGGLGVPLAVAGVVPFVEIGVGALLMVQLQRHAVAWVAIALFVAFTAMLLLRLAQGQRPPCACFGSLSSEPIGAGHVVRNLVLICLAALAAVL